VTLFADRLGISGQVLVYDEPSDRLHLLYLAYAKWCAARGEVALEEAKVVAALQAHGVTVRTAPLTQTALVVGVRVVA
jgi:hypothetical protein